MAQEPVLATGVRLATLGDRILVEVEISGVWVEVINEYYDGNLSISHIVEPLGMTKAFKSQTENISIH